MKETNWDDCLTNRTVRTISPDRNRAKSLLETANERIGLIIDINPRNCNFVFEDYYTSILEMFQAIAFQQGYNILNHMCLGLFIKEVLNREDLYNMFDDLRYKRNSLTYYGNRMDYETAKQAIERCKRIISELNKLK